MNVDDLPPEIRELSEAFELGAKDGETPEDLGLALIDFILKALRAKYRVADDDPRREAVDNETLGSMDDPVQLGPEHSVTEGVLRRLRKNPGAAVAYLTQHVEDRSATQASRARRPRRRDIFTQLIEDFVEEQPNIRAKDVERRLCAMDEVQENGGELRHLGEHATMRLSNLPSRVADAKKRLKKNSS